VPVQPIDIGNHACFNAQDYLREAVDSGTCATYPRVELIVVDDGSTDPDASTYSVSMVIASR